MRARYGLGVVAAVALIIGAAQSCNTSSPSGSGVNVPASTPASAPSIPGSTATTASTTSTTAAPQTLLNVTGNGDQNLQPFTAAGAWQLAYSFNCANAGGEGNFIVSINVNGQPSFTDQGPNSLAASGQNTDYEPKGGQIQLQVASECDWAIKAVG